MTRWQKSFPWSASVLRFFWPAGPARRKRWIKIAVAVALIVAVHAAITAVAALGAMRAEDRFVARWGAMQATLHAPPKVKDASNKARAVRAAVEMMSLPEAGSGADALTYERLATGPEKTLAAADRDALRKIIADNAVTFSILDLAARRPQSNWDLHYEKGIEVDVPPLLRLLHLAKLNAAAGHLALEDGRIDDALTALRRGRTIVASLDREPILIVQLVRLAAERIHERLLRRVLATTSLDAPQLEALVTMLPEVQARSAVQAAMIVETKAMQELFRSGRGASAYLSEESSFAGTVSTGLVRVVARPYLLREERLWIENMASNVERLDAPRSKRGARQGVPAPRRWDVLASLVLMNLEGAIERADLAEIRSELAKTAIAIERRRLATGRPPAALDELVPELLPSAPIDPWTGRPFRYQATATTWSLKSEADLTGIESVTIAEPVLAWGRPAAD